MEELRKAIDASDVYVDGERLTFKGGDTKAKMTAHWNTLYPTFTAVLI
jgi:hypothetical protein